MPMDVIVIVYKRSDRIEFIGRTSEMSRLGRRIDTFSHLGTKTYKSARHLRKEELDIGKGAQLEFKEV